MSWKTGRFWPWDLDEGNEVLVELREFCPDEVANRKECEKREGPGNFENCFKEQTAEKMCMSKKLCPRLGKKATDPSGDCCYMPWNRTGETRLAGSNQHGKS